jgi:ABC-type Zn uptake system ZnuABC Zn-binding protein ZnuA
VRFILPLLLIVVAVAAAGCGSSSDKSSAPAAATETSAANNSGDNNSGATTEESSSGGSLAGSKEDCLHLAQLGQKYSKALQAANPANGGDVKAQLSATAKAFQEFANEAPDAVKNDFKVFAAAFTSYADALSGVNLSSGQTPSAADIAKLQAAAQKLNSGDLQKASAHLTAWAQKNCHGVASAFGK